MRGAGTEGDPAGRLVPRLTIRPSLLTLAALAPLTAGSGVGNRLSAIDDGPGGATSAPPAINHKERHTITTITTTVAGNLTRDPEIRYTRDGQATTALSLAVNRRWQNRDTKEWEESTSFFDVVCWRELAENVALSLTKGARVVVSGRLEQRSWETDDGERKAKVEIVADDIGASLRFATTEIQKVERHSAAEELADEATPV